MGAKLENTTIIHAGRVFTLAKERLTLENGNTVDLEIIRHPGAAAIVPLKGKDNLLLIKQFRRAAGGYIWEIPAGTLNKGEDPLTCAHRELEEETGFSARSMEKMGEIIPVPGYSDERIHIFLAADLVPATQNLDKDELLSVHEIPVSEAISMALAGRIQDGKTLAGLFFLNLKRNNV
ncbi:MAG: NUDIX hydrolase [Desulfobacteraceae bacterium]|jgi:ADP-ribose pyrophosphatase|nr:MAG: NUDIX hydrolase [Desulfobacteraceae bacterium]